ncbi:MAG: DUF721 domain-containing protein [Endomicrobia bacterium]|nr:DUF721 domain-containing protein [Endomicrobiia bacterium]MCX7940333.1 DUF721 domain-containing protein [Endomicrobiia bacterium]MDW8055726.1 DciA family protein [Elusimicrobiota bacterium]
MQEFSKAKYIIERILSRYGITKQLFELYDIWNEVIGEKLARKIQLCGIKDGNILVTVENPAYHYYLKLHQKEILEKITKKLSDKFLQCEQFKNIKVVKL